MGSGTHIPHTGPAGPRDSCSWPPSERKVWSSSARSPWEEYTLNDHPSLGGMLKPPQPKPKSPSYLALLHLDLQEHRVEVQLEDLKGWAGRNKGAFSLELAGIMLQWTPKRPHILINHNVSNVSVSGSESKLRAKVQKRYDTHCTRAIEVLPHEYTRARTHTHTHTHTHTRTDRDEVRKSCHWRALEAVELIFMPWTLR